MQNYRFISGRKCMRIVCKRKKGFNLSKPFAVAVCPPGLEPGTIPYERDALTNRTTPLPVHFFKFLHHFRIQFQISDILFAFHPFNVSFNSYRLGLSFA